MKNLCKTIIGMACFLAMPYHSHAQSAEDVVQEAVDILKGKDLSKSTDWAIETLKSIDDETYRPVAMNALGVVYLKGIGVVQDSAQAVTYFETAARLGHTNAYYNLGMMMKNAPRGKLDFTKAMHYFEKGAERGNMACVYAAGYMCYKGLGCSQDYRRAVEYFRSDMKGVSPSCQYMLGLCYRNGFGVEQDDEKADEYLKKASMANYRFAIEETLRENAEVEPSTVLAESDEYIPNAMPDIEPFIYKDNNLCGNYKGVIVTYDWSGKKIIKEDTLAVSFSKTNNDYYGTWIQGNDTLSVKASLDGDGKLLFADSRMFVQDRYTEGKKIECVFDDASLALVGPSLSGGLRMYSFTHNEPMRPMYLSLSKSGADGSANDPYECIMAAYPGNGNIEVRFLLPQDVKEAVIRLTDQSGTYAKTYKLGALSAGQQRFTITTNCSNGLYVVNMKADNYHGHTTILLNK